MKQYEGITYSWQPSTKDFPELGCTPHYYLYCFMAACSDFASEGKHHRVSDPSFWDTVTAKVKAVDMEQRRNPDNKRHFIGWETTDGNYIAIIRKIAEDNGGKAMFEDKPSTNPLPGTNFRGGLVMLVQERHYLQVTMPPRRGDDGHPDKSHPHGKGSSYVMVLRNAFVTEVNGKKVGEFPYTDSRAKEFVAEFCELTDYDLEQSDASEQERWDSMIHWLWSLKPSGSKQYLSEALTGAIHALCRCEYKQADKEWPGYPDHETYERCSLRIAYMWVHFLARHKEKGTHPDYVSSFGSWLRATKDQLLLEGTGELPDGAIRLENETAQVQKNVLSRMMAKFATDVACSGRENEEEVLTYLFTSIGVALIGKLLPNE